MGYPLKNMRRFALLILLEVVLMTLAVAQELYIRDLPNGAKLIIKPRDDT